MVYDKDEASCAKAHNGCRKIRRMRFCAAFSIAPKGRKMALSYFVMLCTEKIPFWEETQ